jgi:hypothetical protein
MRVRSATGQCLGRRSRSTVNCPRGAPGWGACVNVEMRVARSEMCVGHLTSLPRGRRGLTAESGLTPWRRGLGAGLSGPGSGESSLPSASSQMHPHAEYVLAEIVRIAA